MACRKYNSNQSTAFFNFILLSESKSHTETLELSINTIFAQIFSFWRGLLSKWPSCWTPSTTEKRNGYYRYTNFKCRSVGGGGQGSPCWLIQTSNSKRKFSKKYTWNSFPLKTKSLFDPSPPSTYWKNFWICTIVQLLE